MRVSIFPLSRQGWIQDFLKGWGGGGGGGGGGGTNGSTWRMDTVKGRVQEWLVCNTFYFNLGISILYFIF